MLTSPYFVFQPVVDLRTGQPQFFEMLLRLRGTENPIDAFIQQSEVSGGILHVDVFAIRSALVLLQAYPNLQLSVNVSPVSIAADAAALLQAACANGPACRRMIVEITEGSPIRDPQLLAKFIAALRAHKVRVAVDDYGDGFAGLPRALRSKPDIIKLSYPRLHELFETIVPSTLLESIAVAHELGALVVVERIEATSIVASLTELGVQLGQGFGLGRPGFDLNSLWHLPNLRTCQRPADGGWLGQLNSSSGAP